MWPAPICRKDPSASAIPRRLAPDLLRRLVLAETLECRGTLWSNPPRLHQFGRGSDCTTAEAGYGSLIFLLHPERQRDQSQVETAGEQAGDHFFGRRYRDVDRRVRVLPAQ